MPSARSNVVRLRDHKKPKTYDSDAVFFTKNQISVGTVMIYVGRLDPSAWIVSKIVNTDSNGKRHLVQTVEKFDDIVYLKRSNGTPSMAQRAATFAYLSYSAIWRVG